MGDNRTLLSGNFKKFMGIIMSKLVKTKNWMPIDEFLKKIGMDKKTMYWYIFRRQWYDGFVVKKPRNGNNYVAGCYEDFEEWLG